MVETCDQVKFQELVYSNMHLWSIHDDQKVYKHKELIKYLGSIVFLAFSSLYLTHNFPERCKNKFYRTHFVVFKTLSQLLPMK